MSAAHGFFQVSGAAQAVIVHVDCGTQSLGGAVHNAARGRIPMIVFAGLSPATQQGERTGSRNEFIQWIQDARDQRGIVRGYMKYDNEIRTGANAADLVRRACQIATSDPKGPVYLVGAREIMEEPAPSGPLGAGHWAPIEPAPLPDTGARTIARALAHARQPLVVTSYLGRDNTAVEALIALCRRHAVGVLESVPTCMNYPHDDECYLGNHWNQQAQHPALAEADVVLVIDSDVPWIPTVNRPAVDATVFHIDVDPLKEQMPLWHIDAAMSFRADAGTAIRQVEAYLRHEDARPANLEARRARLAERHRVRQQMLRDRERPLADDGITPEYLMACLRRQFDEETIVMNEAITNYPVVYDHLACSKPGAIFASGGGSLGWNGGAAIGAKLARPDATVVAVTGDGSYMFSSPSAVHWMAKRYDAPFLQVVLNNDGWRAPRFSALNVHPDGFASRAASLDLSFAPAPDYAGIAAAAGGAEPFRLTRASEVPQALAAAMRTVRGGRAAVVDARLVESS